MKSATTHSTWGKYIFLAFALVLFSLSFFFNTLYTNRTSVAREAGLAEKYIRAQQKNFNDFLADSALLRKLATRTESYKELELFTDRNYGIFLYDINDFGEVKMLRWSDQLVVPPFEMFTAADGEYFTKLSNGWYFIIKQSIRGAEADLAFAMIPVSSEFFIETDYLPQQFSFGNEAEKRVRLSESVTEFPVKAASGKILFYLEKKTAIAVPFNDRLTLYLRFGGILFLLVFIHKLSDSISRRYGPWKAISALLLILIGLRAGTYILPELLRSPFLFPSIVMPTVRIKGR